MTLGQFSILVGAPKRWVQNAFQALGLAPVYTESTARRLAFARVLKEALGMPLRRAYPLGQEAPTEPPGTRSWQVQESDGTVRMTVDLDRFEREFAVRRSLARCWYAERRRGRPVKERRRGLGLAEWYGVDISLLKASLALTPAQRLRRLEEAAAFVREARVRR